MIVISTALFVVAPEIAWHGMAPIALILYGSFRYRRLLEPRYAAVREQVGALNGTLANNLSGIATVDLYQRAMASTRRILDLLAVLPAIVDGRWRLDGPRQGALAFDDVHFAYADGAPVLRGLDLDVPAGSTTSIVGATGGEVDAGEAAPAPLRPRVRHRLPRGYDTILFVCIQSVRAVRVRLLRVRHVRERPVRAADLRGPFKPPARCSGCGGTGCRGHSGA